MTGVCSQPWQFSPAENKQKSKSIAVLGSTGSIGCSTLDLVARSPERFRITALTANRNVDLLIEQARQFQPDFVAIGDVAAYGDQDKGGGGAVYFCRRGRPAAGTGSC